MKPQGVSVEQNKSQQTIRVTLEATFPVDEWAEFLDFYHAKRGEGFLCWILDLRQLPDLSSLLLGMLVTLNASVANHGGSLTLLVFSDSYVDRILQGTLLDRVLQIERIR